MILSVILNIFILFVTVSSIILGKATHNLLLILTATTFILLILLEKKYPRLRYLQLILLGLFHWTSQLNWVMAIYLMVAAKEIFYQKGIRYRVLLFTGLALLYTSIRLTYIEHTIYSFLVIFPDLLGFITVALFINYILNLSHQKQALIEENKQLTTLDYETGLLNFHTFQNRLDELIDKQRSFILVILDCTDISKNKALQKRRLTGDGALLLNEVASFLRNHFPLSHAISRYGGDEFALLIPEIAESSSSVVDQVLRETLPNQLGIETTYGAVSFPIEAQVKTDLISVAEARLFDMKKERWLKQEEQSIQEEKLKMVGELAAGLAHEIRNPLTTVKGFLQVASASGYNIEQWYDVIMDEITRVNQLTVEFLQFSKPQESQLKVIPIHECVERVINLMESEAALQGHALEYTYVANRPYYCLMDRDKIVQVLINLLKNAFQAMEKKGRVELTVYPEQESVYLVVKDTGPGIPKDVLAQIFNPFFTTKEEGTGLGLSICHKIIRDHQGTLAASSELGVGTTFVISLPLSAEQCAS